MLDGWQVLQAPCSYKEQRSSCAHGKHESRSTCIGLRNGVASVLAQDGGRGRLRTRRSLPDAIAMVVIVIKSAMSILIMDMRHRVGPVPLELVAVVHNVHEATVRERVTVQGMSLLFQKPKLFDISLRIDLRPYGSGRSFNSTRDTCDPTVTVEAKWRGKKRDTGRTKTITNYKEC